MSESLSHIKRAFEHWRAAFEETEKAHKELSGGPAYYYFEKVEGYVNALFGKYAPLHEGDRVELIRAPEIGAESRWQYSKHFLVPGNPGIVRTVDYYDNQFYADVIFDRESWIDKDGIERPAENRHYYRIEADILKLEVAA